VTRKNVRVAFKVDYLENGSSNFLNFTNLKHTVGDCLTENDKNRTSRVEGHVQQHVSDTAQQFQPWLKKDTLVTNSRFEEPQRKSL
jgi:hypothetical protein